jgi:TPP-dependent trihydroxycyclohexane-1,2-dione (THcHDO) dehydratase
MTMADMETAVRERAHVLAVVFDNGRYGTIWRHQQERGTNVGLGTQLGPVDFAAVAEACGALGIAVRSDEEFEPALRRALEAGRPALIHLALDSRWSTPDAGFAEIEMAPEVETVDWSAESETVTEVPETGPAVEAEAEGTDNTAAEAKAEAVPDTNEGPAAD